MAIREMVLKRDDYQCQMKADGCTGKATEVDHIIPLHVHVSDDLDNLTSLCPECHYRKTTADTQKRAARQRAEKKERARQNHPGRKDKPA